MRRKDFFKLVMVIATLALAAAMPGISQGQDRDRKVHFLLFADTDDKSIGQGVGNSLDEVAKLHAVLPEGNRGELVIRHGRDFNAKSIILAVRGLKAQADDSLFCHVNCHGAYDAERRAGDPSGGHFFAISSGDLMRKSLWEELRKHDARLTVLMTDTCNSSAAARPAALVPAEFRAMREPKWKSLNALLVSARGAIDVSGAAKDEFGWVGGELPGGWFTYNWINLICESPFPNPERLTWDQFIREARVRTSGFYKRQRQAVLLSDPQGNTQAGQLMRNQPDLRPIFFRLQQGEPARLAGSYFLTNRATGKQLDLPVIAGNPNGAKLHAHRLNEQANQVWEFEETSPGIYALHNVGQGKCLDAAVIAGNPDGAVLHGWEYRGTMNQMWLLETLENGCIRLQNYQTRKYVDNALLANNPDGAPIYAHDDNGQDNQMWQLRRRE